MTTPKRNVLGLGGQDLAPISRSLEFICDLVNPSNQENVLDSRNSIRLNTVSNLQSCRKLFPFAIITFSSNPILFATSKKSFVLLSVISGNDQEPEFIFSSNMRQFLNFLDRL